MTMLQAIKILHCLHVRCNDVVGDWVSIKALLWVFLQIKPSNMALEGIDP